MMGYIFFICLNEIATINMNSLRQNVVIIGCGASGLVTLKELLAEGHTGTIFERTMDIGGVFKTAYREGQMVSSTVVTMFSDFLGSDGDRALTHPRMLSFGKFIESKSAMNIRVYFSRILELSK